MTTATKAHRVPTGTSGCGDVTGSGPTSDRRYPVTGPPVNQPMAAGALPALRFGPVRSSPLGS